MASVRRVCVLRSGREYGPDHVRWLARQVDMLQCLSDVPVPGVPHIPLRHNWPGWWSKMELFRPDIDGDLLYLDLDTVVLGEIAPLIEATAGRSTMLSDFYKPHLPASGLMYISQADKGMVWDEWLKDPAGHMNRCRTREHWGDQGFLRDVLPAQRWQDIAPGLVASYKAHCRNSVPPRARVICFHGNPRPWAVKHDWVPHLC